MKSNYDVYLCRGFQQLVGISMNEFLSKMDYLESIKSSGDCWVLFYDDDTKVITRVENMKVGQSAFNQRVSESCFVIGGPFKKAQHIPSRSMQESLHNKILTAYDEISEKRKVDERFDFNLEFIGPFLLYAVGIACIICMWLAAYWQ